MFAPTLLKHQALHFDNLLVFGALFFVSVFNFVFEVVFCDQAHVAELAQLLLR